MEVVNRRQRWIDLAIVLTLSACAVALTLFGGH